MNATTQRPSGPFVMGRLSSGDRPIILDGGRMAFAMPNGNVITMRLTDDGGLRIESDDAIVVSPGAANLVTVYSRA